MNNTIEELIIHLQDESTRLKFESKSISFMKNPSDIGINRENILANVFAKYISNRLQIFKGGYIFDSHGNKSHQLDIIISNNLMLHFSINSQEQFPKIVIPIEGCYTAISIKSSLNEREFFNSIDSKFNSIRGQNNQI
ncbi:MAG: DUF6602 domain-containing protein [Nitrososphaeraceae archaeon]